MSTGHIPVLVREVLEGLDVGKRKKYIDATIGSGGHAVEIVKRGGIVLGIDTDPAAVSIARRKKLAVVQGNFRDIEAIAKREGFTNVDGILFDLGVSSMQLDSLKRGFSYRYPLARLDLRMDQSQGEAASELVNRARGEELYDIFSTFGEEQLAGAIADAICRARTIRPIETVGDMVGVVETVVPNINVRYGVLSRIFQALRIAVNDELENLKYGLIGAKELVRPGGKLLVISFQSLEDRIVKQFMRGKGWERVSKHPIRPGASEIEENVRSRSAKLRIARKIE
ncbi:MAG TPA: 16S rRNA (cytosine(1402)-N(4))-methyltransferase RsmH [Patescibacteria group bacterium]|nr:16S rRNA (cytosine(1402)-N(4))-methyltransferase RsmH [Patescibacteria group bacterium]